MFVLRKSKNKEGRDKPSVHKLIVCANLGLNMAAKGSNLFAVLTRKNCKHYFCMKKALE